MSEELENKEGKASAPKDVKKPSAEKLKALQLAMEKIDKDHGKGTIMRLGDDSIEDIAVIPTGSIGL
ncbi:MAG: DNA recombination/repair protein RecA, partial [Paludibacteraceae bacterium]|nr:DNA recombination/repair protein RecA [Paludibacteraceae bacterium]